MGETLVYRNNNHVVAEIQCTGLGAEKGLGLYALTFQCQVDLRATPQSEAPYVVRDLTANVYLDIPGSGRNRIYLGHAASVYPIWAQSADWGGRDSAHFRLSLRPEQLRALEDERLAEPTRPRSPRFYLDIGGFINRNDKTCACRASIQYEVNLEKWTQQLRNIGYTDILLFEVSIPPSNTSPKLKDAFKHLHEARRLYDQGEYAAVVRACRLALEALHVGQQSTAQKSEARSLFQNGRWKQLDQVERRLLIEEMVIRYAHLAAHPSTDITRPTTFNRRDAAYVLSLTATMLSHGLAIA